MTMKKTFTTALLVVGMTASSPVTLAQDDSAMDQALQALDAALPGTLMHNPYELQWDKRGNDMRVKIVKADALPAKEAVQVRVKKRQDKPWDSTLGTEIRDGVRKGEKIQAHFWVRTHKAVKGKDTAYLTLFIGRNEEPYDNILAEDIFPDSEWKLMSVTGVAPANFKAGKLKAEYQLGRGSQTVEFGPIYVSTLGMADEAGS